MYSFTFIIEYLKVAVEFPLPIQYWVSKVAVLITTTQIKADSIYLPSSYTI